MIASREAAKPGSEEHEGLGEVDPSPLLCDAEADRSCEARDARESSCPSLRGAQERLASG